MSKEVSRPLASTSQSQAEGEFRCNEPNCGKVFSSGKSLGGHKSSAHRNKAPESPPACDTCTALFQNFLNHSSSCGNVGRLVYHDGKGPSIREHVRAGHKFYFKDHNAPLVKRRVSDTDAVSKQTIASKHRKSAFENPSAYSERNSRAKLFGSSSPKGKSLHRGNGIPCRLPNCDLVFSSLKEEDLHVRQYHRRKSTLTFDDAASSARRENLANESEEQGKSSAGSSGSSRSIPSSETEGPQLAEDDDDVIEIIILDKSVPQKEKRHDKSEVSQNKSGKSSSSASEVETDAVDLTNK